MNNLEQKTWYRVLTVARIVGYIFVALVAYGIGTDSAAHGFWVAVVGVAVLELVRQAVIYIIVGKNR